MAQSFVEEEEAPLKEAELETEQPGSSTEMAVASNAKLELPNLVFAISQTLPQFVLDQDLDLDSFPADASSNMEYLTYP